MNTPSIVVKPTSTVTTGHRVPLDRVSALLGIGDALLRAETPEQVLRQVVEGLVHQAGYITAWVLTVEQATQELVGRVGAGIGLVDAIISLRFPLDTPDPMIAVTHTRQTHVITDGVAVADTQGWGDVARKLGLRSLAYVPFGTETEVLGVISISIGRDMVVAEETTLLTLFGNQVATAYLKARSDVERRAQFDALQNAMNAQERLLDTVRDLSTPAIPIAEGILVMPLIGNIDTARADQLMDVILGTIEREHATVVLIDVTGVPIIDTGVASYLVQMTQAAQLLGARCILVGIRPEVAQTLVQLGVDLSGMHTRVNLQAGMALALQLRGRHIVDLPQTQASSSERYATRRS